MPEPWRLLLALVMGVATGVLSGMFGIGGAVVSTPALRIIGVDAIDAVGSTLPSILPSALSGTLRYARDGLIRVRAVLWTSLSGIAAAVLGSLGSHLVPGNGHVLMVATAAIVGFTGWRMIRTARPEESIEEAEPDTLAGMEAGEPDGRPSGVATAATAVERREWWRFAVTGVGAGALSGLLGIGGGVVMVPSFSEWIGLSIKEAVATSLACVGVLAVPSTITHAFLGDIEWWYALALSIGVVPGARLGAILAIRASDRTLRLTVGTMLGILAIVYAVGELLAL